jgi:hypothetical protein
MTLEVVRTRAEDRALNPAGMNGEAIVEHGPKYKSARQNNALIPFPYTRIETWGSYV